MFHRIDEFIQGWKHESATTLKLMETLTDESLSCQVTPEGRTLGYLAWHIALCIGEMSSKAGLPVRGPAEDSDAPSTAAEISAAYRDSAAQLTDTVSAHWTDATLEEEVNMYGEQWKKGFVLSVLLAHEVHHRGQMTVLMRQAGLKVPGVYGPSREEWAAFGMPPAR